jgi:hypothetical protein
MANLINTIRAMNESKELEEKKQSLAASVLDTVNKAMDKDDKEDEKLDKADPKQAKKDFDDRKDKDIDNDGKVDDADKYLHKKRQAVSKAISKDEKKHEKKSTAKASDIEKGKSNGKQEPVEVNPRMNEEVELTEGNAAADLKAYGQKSGGIDKQDFLAIANMVAKKKSAKEIGMMISLLDTDPRDKIVSIINKADKKLGAEIMKAGGMKNLRAWKEEVELEEEDHIGKMEYHERQAQKTKGAEQRKHMEKAKEHRRKAEFAMRGGSAHSYKEEVELDEISKGTVRNYIDKSSKDQQKSLKKRDNSSRETTWNKHQGSIEKRQKGINRAINKLSNQNVKVGATEETELDEAQKQLTPKAVEDHLVKKGVNPKDAKDAVKKGFAYANKKYGGPTYAAALKKVSEVVWSLHEEVELDETVKSPYTGAVVTGPADLKKEKEHYRAVRAKEREKELGEVKNSADNPPFDKPYRKKEGERKDRFGNTIKTKNIAKHLAKKGLKSMKSLKTEAKVLPSDGGNDGGGTPPVYTTKNGTNYKNGKPIGPVSDPDGGSATKKEEKSCKKEGTVTSVGDVKAPVAKPKKNGTVNKVANDPSTITPPVTLKKEGTVTSVGDSQGGKVGMSSTDTAQPFDGAKTPEPKEKKPKSNVQKVVDFISDLRSK